MDGQPAPNLEGTSQQKDLPEGVQPGPQQPEMAIAMDGQVPLAPVIKPRDILNALPEVHQYSRTQQGLVVANPITPEHRQQENLAVIQLLHTFHREEKGQLAPYIAVLRKIVNRYKVMNGQIDIISVLLRGLLGATPRYLAMPVNVLQIIQYEYVNSLANKLKVVFSKGRRRNHEKHEFSRTMNALGGALDIVMRHSLKQSSRRQIREESRRVLHAISNNFHIMSAKAVSYIKYHALPASFDYSLYEGLLFKFYVSFHVQGLLIERNERPTPFPPQLLYCPILWDQKKEHYVIANQYLSLVERAYYNWESKVLCVDFCRKSERKYMTIYTSFLNRSWHTRKLVGVLSLLRDKIYQFQIFEFLKVLFDQNSATIEIPLSKTVVVRISIVQIAQASKFKYATEFITVLFANLRPERRATMDRNTLRKKIRSRLEEIFISRYSAEKMSEELHLLRKDEQLPMQFKKTDKTKLEARDFYKNIENQRPSE